MAQQRYIAGVGYRKREFLVGGKMSIRQGKRGHIWTSTRGVLGPRLVAYTSLGLLQWLSVWPKGGLPELMAP